MEVKLLLKLLKLLLLLLGFSAPALAEPRDFYLVKELKTWTEAQRYCRENFYDLVTLESASDWTRARQLVGRSGHGNVWVGLYDDINSWRWALDNASESQGASIQSISELTFYMDYREGKEFCGYLNSVNQGDGYCGWLQKYVCFDEPTNTYIPIHDMITWQASQTYCREHYTDLASLRNQQERDAILAAIGPTGYWWSIGLYRDGWKWSDQSENSLMVWAPNEPSGGSVSCGAARVDGLNDASCQLQLPFICSGPRRRVLKVALKSSTAVDLNDPLVQEALLKQMEERLNQQGFQQQLRVRWRKQPLGDVFSLVEP